MPNCLHNGCLARFDQNLLTKAFRDLLICASICLLLLVGGLTLGHFSHCLTLLVVTNQTIYHLSRLSFSILTFLVCIAEKNRMCNQWDNWRAYGPELLLYNQLITDPTYNKTCWTDI